MSFGFAFSSSLSNFRSHRQVFSFFLSALNFWFFCFKTKELKRKETQIAARFSKKQMQVIDNQHLFFQPCQYMLGFDNSNMFYIPVLSHYFPHCDYCTHFFKIEHNSLIINTPFFKSVTLCNVIKINNMKRVQAKKRGCPCGAASIYSSYIYYFIFNLAFTKGNILSLSL